MNSTLRFLRVLHQDASKSSQNTARLELLRQYEAPGRASRPSYRRKSARAVQAHRQRRRRVRLATPQPRNTSRNTAASQRLSSSCRGRRASKGPGLDLDPVLLSTATPLVVSRRRHQSLSPRRNESPASRTHDELRITHSESPSQQRPYAGSGMSSCLRYTARNAHGLSTRILLKRYKSTIQPPTEVVGGSKSDDSDVTRM